MENASDAIIMAGAVLIFVIALSVAMTVFSQARETVDSVVYASDRTNYYEYLDMDISNNIPALYPVQNYVHEATAHIQRLNAS